MKVTRTTGMTNQKSTLKVSPQREGKGKRDIIKHLIPVLIYAVAEHEMFEKCHNMQIIIRLCPWPNMITPE